ncbi:coronin-7 isoform X12 [Ostrinia furnacalis]|uniref:coronin-7 isoform X11 n=1 Tax=Ostrinia furnacalis TaxID=93504 RepID=UPI00103EEFE9|nr:coronin-7 isoform X11 [Ostrinia furnacalis]XP_028164829.1 coronin-7 isoform X12 [Ostrinia furnacalis]
MAWRFKASKYKNAAPIVPKPETCIRDICVGSYQTYGNNICASAAFMAFNWEHVGSSMAVLPLDDCGRKSKTMPLLHAHSDTITDMEFSPFHDGLLLTGSQDSLVKVWHIPPEGLKESLSTPECTLSQKQRRVENVGFHPVADGLIHVASGHELALWDLTKQKEAFVNRDHAEVIQSTSWKKDGRLLATSCKDKKVRVIDPRAASPILEVANSHQNIKDSRVVWLGDQDRILTTGFDSARLRQIMIRDIRNLSQTQKTLELDCSTGILMPLFDADTNMLFLAGKGDTTILYMELTDREPYLIEGLRHSGEQTKGACLVPKRALRVMEGEVNRVLQLTGSSVVPIMYQVPRKSYREYHADLYPDTSGCMTYLSAPMWLDNQDYPVPNISLHPNANNCTQPRLGPKPFSASTGNEEFSFDKVFSVPAVPGLPKSDSATSPLSGPTATTPVSTPPVVKEPVEEKEKSLSPTSDVDVAPNKEEYTNGKSDTSLEEEVNSSDSGYRPKTPSTAERRKLFETTDGNNQSIADRRRAYEMRSVSVAVESETPPSPAPLRRRDSLKSRKSPDREDKRASVPNVATKRTSTVFGKVSKFRHLKGTPAHKSLHVENIKNISRQVSGECNGFYANGVHCAVPLSGGGGRVGIITMPLGATRRARGAPPLPGGMVPHALLHPAPLQDWAWDPFDDDRLMVACDDGLVREWIIEEGGLLESSNEPERTFAAHPDKIYLIRFHPTASNLLTTAAHDLTIKIWDLTPEVPVAAITLTGHGDQIFSIDWSPCGEYLATVCRDGLIRIYKPRASTEPLRSGPGPAGSRGARVVWALNATHLVVTGFDKVSERQIYLYKASDLSAPICTVGLDVSPAILQIHIDHDSGTLFLTGRGDSTIYCYEVTCEPPYVCALSHHRAMTLHQGIAFLQKNICAVEKVEFAKALRLTNGTIEPLSFTVPRIKSELFQDDLFPPTLVTWEPWQSGADWLAGRLVPPRTVSLQPPGMEPLSAHTTVSPVAREPREAQKPKPDLIRSHTPLDAKQKQENIMKSMSAKMAVDLKLEQDSMEGVDETEWDQ